MTTQVKIIHNGGSHPVEVVREQTGDVVAKLEKQGDEFVQHVYGNQSFAVREVTE